MLEAIIDTLLLFCFALFFAFMIGVLLMAIACALFEPTSQKNSVEQCLEYKLVISRVTVLEMLDELEEKINSDLDKYDKAYEKRIKEFGIKHSAEALSNFRGRIDTLQDLKNSLFELKQKYIGE